MFKPIAYRLQPIAFPSENISAHIVAVDFNPPDRGNKSEQRSIGSVYTIQGPRKFVDAQGFPVPFVEGINLYLNSILESIKPVIQKQTKRQNFSLIKKSIYSLEQCKIYFIKI